MRKESFIRLKNFYAMVFLFSVTTVILPPAVLAKGNDADKLQQLIVQSGFQKQFDVLSEFMSAMYLARFKKEQNAESHQVDQIRQIVSQAFVSSQMSEAYRKEIDRGLSPRELEAVLEWMNSPLGTKISQLEQSMSSGVSLKKIQSLANKAEKDPSFVPRNKILSELDGAAHFSEARIQMKMEIAKAMSRFSDQLSGQTLVSEKELTARLGKEEALMKSAASRDVYVSGLHIYQSLSNVELTQYLEFYKSPAGKKYAVLCRKAFNNVFANALHAAEKQIVNEFKGNDKK